uniref:Uncharacterized protein n=1 Tax=Romanomermis culicivorax TaxID=13658 RepID=A0A915JVH6_ROMCU
MGSFTNYGPGAGGYNFDPNNNAYFSQNMMPGAGMYGGQQQQMYPYGQQMYSQASTTSGHNSHHKSHKKLTNTRLLVRRQATPKSHFEDEISDDKTNADEEEDSDSEVPTFTIVLYSGLVVLLVVMGVVAYYMMNRNRKRAFDKTWTTASTRSRTKGTSADATKSAEINAIERMKNVKLWRDTKMDTEQMILMQTTRDKQRRIAKITADKIVKSSEKLSLPAKSLFGKIGGARKSQKTNDLNLTSTMTATAKEATTMSGATISMPTQTKDSVCKMKAVGGAIRNKVLITKKRTQTLPLKLTTATQETLRGDPLKAKSKDLDKNPTNKLVKKA